MFGSRLSLPHIKLGRNRSGSYEVSQAPPPAADENNNPTIQPAEPESADLGQNQPRRPKKLRSVSFSRFVHLKSNSYDLPQTSRPTNNARPTNNTTNNDNNNNNNAAAPPTANERPPIERITKDGVTLCTLGVGTTFGASVMPGKSHSVSVVTNEECTLLRVRRADFQEIFNEQSHLINDLESSPFYPFSSMGKSLASQSSDSGALTRVRPVSHSARLAERQMSIGGPAGSSPERAVALVRRPSLSSEQQAQRPSSGQSSTRSSQQSTHASRRISLASSAPEHQHRHSIAAAASDQIAFEPQLRPRRSLKQQQAPQQQQQQQVPPADGRQTMNGAERQRRPDEPDAESEQQKQQQLEEELNLDSLDATELTNQLMRIGWVLRTLILAEAPQMIKNRRVYPQLHHSLLGAAHQSSSAKLAGARQPQRAPAKSSRAKQLVSAGSSSQLFLSSTASSASSSSAASTTKSVASSAGRKVANYVASSFMRTTGGKQPAPAPVKQEAAASGGARYVSLSNSSPQQQRQCSSFDQEDVIAAAEPKPAAAQTNHHHHHHHHHQPDLSQEPVQLSRCLVGREMVDWLQQLSQNNTSAGRFVSSRLQAVSMWQVLLEQEIILGLPVPSPAPPSSRRASGAFMGIRPDDSSSSLSSVQRRDSARSSTGSTASGRRDATQFCDDQQAYYKFWFDCEPAAAATTATTTNAAAAGKRRGSASSLAPAGSRPASPERTVPPLPKPPSESDTSLANEALWWSLKLLSKLAPDACFRLILGKQPHERGCEEVDIVFEELQHLKALSHLTNSVKKQLAACVGSEHHARQNTVIFNQGDAGHSWYIILRGSVNVVIVGKGVVCTLHDGDDFGKLALVNDAPRAATIVTNEPNCYFLRVDKQDFNTILRDVEANTVRLKEHGKEVLILQKVAIKEQPEPQSAGPGAPASSVVNNNSQAGPLGPAGAPELAGGSAGQLAAAAGQQASPAGGQSGVVAGSVSAASTTASAAAASQVASCALKYMVMAGTAEKMLEHLLETRIDGQTQTAPLSLTKEALYQHDRVANYIQCHGDNFLEDFILTHKIFMPTGNLCQELLKQYQSSGQARAASQATAAAASAAPGNGQQKQRPINSLVDDEYLVAKKRRVIKFVRFWMLINREHFFQQQQIHTFVMTLHQKVKTDAQRFASLRPELEAITRIYELQLEESLDARHRGCQRWIEDVYGNILPIRRHLGPWQAPPPAGGAGQGASAQANEHQQQQMAASEQFLASLHQRRFHHALSTIQAEDELVFRVYCADHSYTTLKCRFDEQAGQIKQVAARNLKLDDKELILVHVKSNGERIIYNDQETNICTCLSVNGRLFVCPLEHIDAVSPLPEQDPFQEVYQSLSCIKQQQALDENSGPTSGAANPGGGQLQATNPLAGSALANQQEQGAQPINSHLLAATPTNHADIKLQMSLSVSKLEEFSSRDIAYCLTQLAWSLLKNMHEFELVYTVFGRHNFKQITANLNVFLRHFNELQFWVVTQICLSTSLSKRVQILRKFIKIAAHCKELQNLNAFFAIIMGLSNMAVARLTQTWERIPNKLKRTFSQFESQIDPSRNHRCYRLFLSTLEPPIIPFMPLFLKDMTFAHEGNKTYLESGLINFEKMQMIAQTLRTIRCCKSRAMKLDPSACKFKSSIRSIDLFFRDLKIIDNQRTLTQMSHQLEHRKT